MKTKKSILIIEDDPPLQQTLALMFQRGGHTAVSAAPNSKVLEILDNYPFDLIVLDLNQTCDNCLSLFFKIKKHYPLLPIILLTANTKADSIPGFEEEKDWMIIRKPFEPGFLLKSVHATEGLDLMRSTLPLSTVN